MLAPQKAIPKYKELDLRKYVELTPIKLLASCKAEKKKKKK